MKLCVSWIWADYFLPQVRKVVSFYLFKYFLRSFLSSSSGTPIMQILMCLMLSQRCLKLSLFFFFFLDSGSDHYCLPAHWYTLLYYLAYHWFFVVCVILVCGRFCVCPLRVTSLFPSPGKHLQFRPCCWAAKSCLTLATPWTVACQALLFMGFPRQEYWSGLPFPSPEDLLTEGLKPCLLNRQADSLPLNHQGSPQYRPAGLQSWMLWGLVFPVLEPWAGEPYVGDQNSHSCGRTSVL